MWFFAVAGGNDVNIQCWNDVSINNYDATEISYVPNYTCPTSVATTSWTWNRWRQIDAGSPVTEFHLHSLHNDVALGDYSDLYRLAIWVR